MQLLIEQILNGLAMGSIYAIITLGLALVYGVMRILHVAHASIYTVGAYAGVFIFQATGSLALAFLGSMLLCAILGVHLSSTLIAIYVITAAIQKAIASVQNYNGLTGTIGGFNMGQVVKDVQVQVVKNGQFHYKGVVNAPSLITP